MIFHSKYRWMSQVPYMFTPCYRTCRAKELRGPCFLAADIWLCRVRRWRSWIKSGCTVEIMIYTSNLKHLFTNGCFNWMIPNLYMENGCLTTHPLKIGCLEFQVLVIWVVWGSLWGQYLGNNNYTARGWYPILPWKWESLTVFLPVKIYIYINININIIIIIIVLYIFIYSYRCLNI